MAKTKSEWKEVLKDSDTVHVDHYNFVVKEKDTRITELEAENQRLKSTLEGIESVRQMQVRNIEKLQTEQAELLDTCKALLQTILYAEPGAFKNGVVDPNSHIDEGEVLTGRLIEQAAAMLKRIR
ncbi:MAG: hypothetical protein ACXABY_07960 [Candidatus Thorarchaeota archaeon]|jgi:hypothetical protein